MIRVVFEGEKNHVEVHQHVYNLAENPKALRATREAISLPNCFLPASAGSQHLFNRALHNVWIDRWAAVSRYVLQLPCERQRVGVT